MQSVPPAEQRISGPNSISDVALLLRGMQPEAGSPSSEIFPGHDMRPHRRLSTASPPRWVFRERGLAASRQLWGVQAWYYILC